MFKKNKFGMAICEKCSFAIYFSQEDNNIFKEPFYIPLNNKQSINNFKCPVCNGNYRVATKKEWNIINSNNISNADKRFPLTKFIGYFTNENIPDDLINQRNQYIFSSRNSLIMASEPEYQNRERLRKEENMKQAAELHEKYLNAPKCPTCNSTNISRISGTHRVVSTGLLGLASSDIGKTMCCKSCGYKW